MVGGRRVVIYVFLVASIGLTAAIAGDPQTFRFEGLADAQGRDWVTHRVEVPEVGTLEAELSWSDPAADLNIFVKGPDGRQLARTSGDAHPEHLQIEATMTGAYTVAVKAVSGAANYRLDVTYTPSGNHAPVAGPDTAKLVTGRSIAVDVLANDSDPDGDPLKVVSVSTPAHGFAKLRRDLKITYSRDQGFTGEDRFTYRVCDAGAAEIACAEGTVTVAVGESNQAPLAEPDHADTQDAVVVDVLANDSDPDGDRLTLTQVEGADHGTVDISGGEVSYRADGSYTGTDDFTYEVCDDAFTAACSQGAVTVEVLDAPDDGSTPTGSPPDAVDDRARTEAGQPVTIDVLANDTDPDGDALRVTSVTQGAAGATEITAEGQVRYRPVNDAGGSDTFTYIACEVAAEDRCDRATVEVFNAWLEQVDLRDPITIDLHVGPDKLRLDDTRDYILRMPDAKKTGVLEIVGGRNISIVGGYMSVATPGPNINIIDGPGAVDGRVVHIEGVLIDGSSGAESDGIKIKAPKATVQLKNVRIVGLLGTFDTIHADLIQPWGGVGELRISGFTGASHYNSLYLRRENDPLMPPIGTVRIQRANIFGYVNGGGEPGSTLRGISIGTQSAPPSDATQTVNCRMTDPMFLDGFYVDPPGTKALGQFVYPHDKMQTAGCPAEVAPDGGSVDWPALRAMVSGVVLLGPPPGGDFVPAGMAGLDYRG